MKAYYRLKFTIQRKALGLATEPMVERLGPPFTATKRELKAILRALVDEAQTIIEEATS